MTPVHLHLLLNHVPVVGIFICLALFAPALLRRASPFTRFGFGLVALLGAIAVAVYFTGGAAEETVEKLAGVTESGIESHEEAAELAIIAFSVFGVLALAALARFRSGPMPRWVGVGAFVAAAVLSGIMGWTANLGGQIRHTEIRGSSNSPPAGESPD